MKIRIILFAFAILFGFNVNAQDEEVIDASKPTNFYSFIDNTLENTFSPNQNVMGYRGKVTFTPSEAHLLLGEVPLLYNDRTGKFGVGDLRARYFWLPYKNYEKLLGAFGPSIDIFAPTGSFENGIGGGRWIISPGITVGIMVADWIQFFPILSYQYASEMVKDVPVGIENTSASGITFQVITPIVFSQNFFMQITPIFRANNLNDARQDRYIQEFFTAYTLKNGMQLTGFYSGNFKDKIHQVSVGLTVYL